jgi:hypothetical protein
MLIICLCLDAELAGIKDNDRLIEINGQNIESLNHEQATECIRTVRYPEPLQMLVSDTPTYDYYRQQQKHIHSGLANVRTMSPNKNTS